MEITFYKRFSPSTHGDCVKGNAEPYIWNSFPEIFCFTRVSSCPQCFMIQFDKFLKRWLLFFPHLEVLSDLALGKSQIGFQLELDENDFSELGTILACPFLSPVTSWTLRVWSE